MTTKPRTYRLPDDVAETLRRQAERHRRTMTAQVIYLIEEGERRDAESGGTAIRCGRCGEAFRAEVPPSGVVYCSRCGAPNRVD